jgi:hypothetical protein
MTATAFWRRLDVPGHDACRLTVDGKGWRLEGTAVFLNGGRPSALSYRIAGDSTWRTREGSVTGFAGDTLVGATITRTTSGIWTLNGVPQAGLDDCDHLDLAFTPATNLPHVKALGPNPGESIDVPVAWLDLPCLTLARLPQRYTRCPNGAVRYEAQSTGYAAELTFQPSGFVRDYPGLWECD